MGDQRYDVAVVGAGSAGGPVAARLSEDPSRTVVLLEAGEDFPDEAIAPPSFVTGGNAIGGWFAGVGAAVPAHDWHYEGEPLRTGRRIPPPPWRLVGGSSMINGGIAVRAKPSDFDDWVALGAQGWGWDVMRPIFERVEAELGLKHYRRSRWQPFLAAFVDALVELGFREVDDMNAPDAWDGVCGAWPQNRRNEIRRGSLVTYIRQARARPNVRIVGDALVDRVLLRSGRVTGVRYADAGGRPVELEADRVVLCGGAYGSPAILLRSGIGPAAHLRDLGIGVVEDLPVGGRCAITRRRSSSSTRRPRSPRWRRSPAIGGAATAGGRSRSPSTRTRACAPSRSRTRAGAARLGPPGLGGPRRSAADRPRQPAGHRRVAVRRRVGVVPRAGGDPDVP